MNRDFLTSCKRSTVIAIFYLIFPLLFAGACSPANSNPTQSNIVPHPNIVSAKSSQSPIAITLTSTLPTNLPTITLTSSETTTPLPTYTPSITPTSSSTPTPTLTPTATLTPIPQVLGSLPSIDNDDVAINAGNFLLQITGIMEYPQVLGLTPSSNTRFLVLEVNIYNYSSQQQDFFDDNFPITINNDKSSIIPNIDRMNFIGPHLYKLTKAPCCPGKFFPVVVPRFIVGSKSWEHTILVYETPANVSAISLEFHPPFIQSSTIGIWMPERSDETVIFFKESVNGEPLYHRSFRVLSRDFIRPIRTEMIDIDNCNNTGPHTEKRTLSETNHREISVGGGFDGSGAQIPEMAVPKPLKLVISAVDIAKSLLSAEYKQTEGDTLQYSRDSEFTAAAGTHTQFLIEYNKIAIKGIMAETIGSKTVEIPYIIDQDIEVKALSLPEIACHK